MLVFVVIVGNQQFIDVLDATPLFIAPERVNDWFVPFISSFIHYLFIKKR
jgi:hypothetical protein